MNRKCERIYASEKRGGDNSRDEKQSKMGEAYEAIGGVSPSHGREIFSLHFQLEITQLVFARSPPAKPLFPAC